MTLLAWWKRVWNWGATKDACGRMVRRGIMDGPSAPVQQLLSLEAPPSPLSSRPKRGVVERSAVCLSLTAATGYYGPTLCHLDRSEAQWRDLRFTGPLMEMFFLRSAGKHLQERASTQRSLHYAALRSR